MKVRTRLDQVLGGDADGPLLLLLQLRLSQHILQAGVKAALREACCTYKHQKHDV